MDEYDRIYRRKLGISAVAHLAVVAVALGLNFIQGCFGVKKTEVSYDEIEFTVAAPAGATGIVQPDPVPPPVPPPEPPPEPPPKHEIKISTEIRSVTAAPIPTTTRPPVPAPVANRPGFDNPLSEAEIRKYLNAGAKQGDINRIPANEMRRCMLIIENALYSAWKRPSAEHDTSRGAEVTIVISSTGLILTSSITRGSGNKIYDQSVLNAVSDTARFSGLTPDFIKQYEKGVIIEFKLK